MASARTSLIEDEPVLTAGGTAIVVHVSPSSVELRDCLGGVTHQPWTELPTIRNISNGQVQALAEPLRPLWDTLSDNARTVALMRLEVVQEVVTGFRDGHPELARDGEPHYPFGPMWDISESRRCDEMARLLTQEKRFDRVHMRRVRDGELRYSGTSPNTVRKWVRDWREAGLWALIDKRSTRECLHWERIDECFRAALIEEFDALDGTKSTVSQQEIIRRARVALLKKGIEDPYAPERETQSFVSAMSKRKGATTRAQRSNALRKDAGTSQYPAVRPGQVVCIDVTPADNLVYDVRTGDPMSVEIVTAIDLATRVVLAVRVVPRSANGIELGLIAYDICRPFSIVVQGESVSGWRWCGLPEQLDLSLVHLRGVRQKVTPDLTTNQGVHHIPSVMPDALHSDRGSIFRSVPTHDLLGLLGISLLLSRPKHPTDNPQIERMHETYQRALQKIPGYKGRNTSERGVLVSKEPLLTAQELQEELRRFIVTDYHVTGHDGLVRHNEPGIKTCPLERWDELTELTGRIDVPQQPDLIYQFLPIRWATIGDSGVELFNLAYSSPVLDAYRAVPVGFFRSQDKAAPFYVDPRDMSRIWFRDPKTKLIHPIECRDVDLDNAPMSAEAMTLARRRVRERGGNAVVSRKFVRQKILKELTAIASPPVDKEAKRKLAAAAQRVEQSRIDHAEAQQAQQKLKPAPKTKQSAVQAALRRPWPNLLEGA